MSVASELQGLSLGEGLQNKKCTMIPTKTEELKQTAGASNSIRSSMDNAGERCTGEANLAAKPIVKPPRKPAIDVFAQ